VQVDPIKPTLKAPGTKHLILKYDEPPSNFAFKFNLRRYTEVRDAQYLLNVLAHNYRFLAINRAEDLLQLPDTPADALMITAMVKDEAGTASTSNDTRVRFEIGRTDGGTFANADMIFSVGRCRLTPSNPR